MTLPTFIIFGTRKAGTTSLYHYLNQHPQIYMSDLKGSKYFLFNPDEPKSASNFPVKNIIEYKKLFEGANSKNASAIGEATPSYLCSESAASRIKETIPGVLLIASLRNPVDRVYSQYQMQMRNLKKNQREDFTVNNLDKWTDEGFYYKHIKSYFKLFNHNQIKVIIFEKWIQDPLAMLRNMYEFLDVDTDFIPDISVQYNQGGFEKYQLIESLLRHRKIFIKLKPFVPREIRKRLNLLRNINRQKAPILSNEIRNYLGNIFLDDINKLEDLIKQDLSIWKVANK